MYTIASVWDIDNCIAADHWRQGRINWELHGDDRYRDYNAQAINDLPAHQREFEFIRRLGARPVFFSGRPEYMRSDTVYWLNLHFAMEVGAYRLYLRPSQGLTPRALKENMLQEFMLEYQDVKIIAAFDDIPSIVSMYRSYGIPAARVAVHHDLSGAYADSDLV